MAAGDTILSFGTIMITADGTCHVRLDAHLLDRENRRHRLRTQNVKVTLTPELTAQITALRASIETVAKATLPADLAGAAVVPATSLQREDRLALRAARDAARKSARDAARAEANRERPR